MAGTKFDFTIQDLNGTPIGFMMPPAQKGHAPSQQDNRRVATRVLADSAVEPSHLDPFVEFIWAQSEFSLGIGGISAEEHLGRIAGGEFIDTSDAGVIKLARLTTAATVTNDPEAFIPSAFGTWGNELWSMQGGYPYRWNFSGKNWERVSPADATAGIIGRDYTMHNGSAFVARVFSANEYPAGEQRYWYKDRVGDTWAEVSAGVGASFAHFTVADGKLWGGWEVYDTGINTAEAVDDSETNIDMSADPTSAISVGDIILMAGETELMLVTAVNTGPNTLDVIRAHFGTTASGSDSGQSVLLFRPNIVRSTTNGTAILNWSTVTTIGGNESWITALAGVGNTLAVIKEDGIYSVENNGAVEHRLPELAAMRHKDFGKGTFVAFGLIFVPLAHGGMLEVDPGTWSTRLIDFSLSMPGLTEHHGKIVAGHGDALWLYILVYDETNATYHVLRTPNPAAAGLSDYAWSDVSHVSFTTSSLAWTGAIFKESQTQASVNHDRVWIGVHSSGSNLVSSYIAHSTQDDDHAFSNSDSAVAYTTLFHGRFPYMNKRAKDIIFRTNNLDNVDTLVDTAETLTTTDTTITVDGNPTGKIAVGDLIVVDSEAMMVGAINAAPPTVTVTRGYAGTTAATHETGAGISARHYIEVQSRVDGGSWAYLSGSQATSTLISDSQALQWPLGTTGKMWELRFYPQRKSVDNDVSPEILDFFARFQLRPGRTRFFEIAAYIANGQRLRNGQIENQAKAKRRSMVMWNDQAAEVQMIDQFNQYNIQFLPGTFKVEVASAPGHGRFPALLVTCLAAEV